MFSARLEAALKALMMAFLIWLMCESYILVAAYEVGPKIFIAIFQASKYFLIILVPVVLLLNCGLDRYWVRFLLLYAFIIAIFTLVSIISGRSLSLILLSLKNIYLWGFYFFLIVSSRVQFTAGDLKLANWVVVIFAIINVVYSLYVANIYEGDPNVFYFYEFYVGKNLFSIWNFVKDDEVRAFGLMGSPLTLSQSLMLPAIFCYSAIFFRKPQVTSIAYFLALIIILLGLYLTKTRNPVLAFILAVTIVALGRNWKGRGKYLLTFALLYISSFLLVLEVNSRGGGDLSSQARIPMLMQFIDHIVARPFGYGIGSTGVAAPGYDFFFESSFSTILMDLGLVGGLVVILMFFKTVMHIKDFICFERKQDNWLFISSMASAFSLLFVTNFSNIFDSSLFLYATLFAVAVKQKKMVGAYE
ncbi:O-antigen ligase family protein [Pseudomonas guariconensis]|uniref:O-antigen ligase family protein n=1 Tax=Pseudomonas guariconensis TaxID=1288410 RepID=UPI0018A8E21A|nr:O-antigen ligase family protein [Pseudomonas guariconensis]MBF8723033.1 hypothetical protein [Pseudomonas guariconensis]